MLKVSLIRRAARKLVWTLSTLLNREPLVRTSSKLVAKCAPPGTDFIYENYLARFAVLLNNIRFIDQQVLHAGYEPWYHLVAETYIPASGAVCIDVGANVGLISILMANRCNLSAQIFAFEPSPPFFERLIQNLALNPGLGKVITATRKGVGEKPGTLNWIEDPTQPGNGMMVAEGGIPVDVITIDDFALQENLTRLDFVKIDVEGMEHEVLKGGMKTWERFRPTILFETLSQTPAEKGYPVWEHIWREFEPLGYQLLSVTDDGKIQPATPRCLTTNSLLVPALKRLS